MTKYIYNLVVGLLGPKTVFILSQTPNTMSYQFIVTLARLLNQGMMEYGQNGLGNVIKELNRVDIKIHHPPTKEKVDGFREADASDMKSIVDKVRMFAAYDIASGVLNNMTYFNPEVPASAKPELPN